MLNKLWEFLGRKNQATSTIAKIVSVVAKPTTPPIQAPLTAEAIYSYITELDRNNPDRFREETWYRGLSFGDLRVDSMGVVTFRTPYEKTNDILLEYVKSILRDVIEEKELVGVSVEDGKFNDEVTVLLSESAPESLKGQWHSGWSRGETYKQRVFLTVEKHDGHALSLRVYSVEALGVVLLFAKRLGLATEPAMYANESDVPLSEIVVYAYAWHDANADKYYTEMKYNPALQKGFSYNGGGWNKDYEEDGKKVIVLASAYHSQQFKLNNQLVEIVKIKTPTRFMLETRDYIQNRERDRNTCKVDNCGREVMYEINVTRLEMSGLGGTSCLGSTYPVCDKPEHIEKIKTTSGGIRSVVQSARKEVW